MMRQTAPMDPKCDTAGYRKALARFPTGVAFVAARSSDGEAGGLLINSFTSVSLAPPMVLWCLGLASRSRRIFAGASTFAVSVLSEEQRSLLSALGRPLEHRLNGMPIRDGLGGADFWRVRGGVGRPDSTDPDIVAAYVLARFRERPEEVEDLVQRAADAAAAIVAGP